MSLEKELKYALTRQEYQRLRRALKEKITSVETQRNYYFDDARFSLRKKRIGLRLRLSSKSGPKLTLKFPHKTQKKQKKPKAFKVRQEIEHPVPLKLSRRILQTHRLDSLPKPILKTLLTHLPPRLLNQLTVFGQLQNHRTHARYRGLHLELDRFKIDALETRYELEIETSQPVAAEAKVKELLASHRIPVHPETTSKLGQLVAKIRANLL